MKKMAAVLFLLSLFSTAESFGSAKYYKMKCTMLTDGEASPIQFKVKNEKEVSPKENVTVYQYVITEGWLKNVNVLCARFQNADGEPVTECGMLGSAKLSKPNTVSKSFDLCDINTTIVCKSYSSFLFF